MQSKRIYTGVLIADDKGEAYSIRGASITEIAEIADQIDFPVDRETFNKTVLENGGYNKLKSVLSELITSGYYHQKVEAARLRMENEIAGYHERVNQILLPELGNVFPGYAPIQIDYFKMGDAYFSLEKPNKKFPVLEIDMMSNRIYVAYKKGRIFYCVHPPFDRMPGGEPIASWLYETGASVQEVTVDALTALKANIESTYLLKKSP